MKNLGLKNLENVKGGGNCFQAGFVIIPTLLIVPDLFLRSTILAGFAYCMVT